MPFIVIYLLAYDTLLLCKYCMMCFILHDVFIFIRRFEMLAKNISVYAVAAVLLSMIFIVGCSSQQDLPNNNLNSDVMQDRQDSIPRDMIVTGDDRRNAMPNQFNSTRSGRYGPSENLTDEERTQMMQQRIQAEIDACADKFEGDVCSISYQDQSLDQYGSRNSTCIMQNDALVCRMDFNGPPEGMPRPN